MLIGFLEVDQRHSCPNTERPQEGSRLRNRAVFLSFKLNRRFVARSPIEGFFTVLLANKREQ